MKKPNNKNINNPLLRRVLKIHNMIKNGKYPNCTDFSKANEMSLATTYRDLDVLKLTLQAPVKFDTSKNGYYYYEDYQLPFAGINDADCESLLGAKMLLECWKGTPIYENLSQTIITILHPDDSKSSNLLDRFAIAPRQKAQVNRTIWNAVIEAMKENNVLEFDYKGRKDDEYRRRIIHPYQLVFDQGSIFVWGFDPSKNDCRTFLFQRIKNIRITDEAFELPKDCKYENRLGGSRFGAFYTPELEKFKLEFYGSARTLVQESTYADDQIVTEDEERNCTILEFTSAQWERIMTWLLSLGAEARPIEPEWLVNEWKGAIDNMHHLAFPES